jgi:hypothetical protein
MKKFKMTALAMGIATAGMFAFKGIDAGSIKGVVTPADGAKTAWALSSTDTLKAAISNGTFEIPNAKPGSYKLIIEANAPYKNTAKEGITVTDGQPTDVGEIKLEK